jgi:hypothetical protein
MTQRAVSRLGSLKATGSAEERLCSLGGEISAQTLVPVEAFFQVVDFRSCREQPQARGILEVEEDLLM